MVKLIDRAQGKFKGEFEATSDRIASLDARRPPSRRLRMIGVSAGVMALVVSALLSGCYYRGRPPEYGRRGYGHHYDRRY